MAEKRQGFGRVSRVWPLALLLIPLVLTGQELPVVRNVDLQPLAAQALRLVETMDYLGAPFDPADRFLILPTR